MNPSTGVKKTLSMKTIHAQGKRKQAIARATLFPGKGKVTINGALLDTWANKILRLRVYEPLALAGDFAPQVNLEISVRGSGASGQADATRLAIARALTAYQPSLKPIFNEYDRQLLVADVRRKEVRKPNDSKARAKRQKSYR